MRNYIMHFVKAFKNNFKVHTFRLEKIYLDNGKKELIGMHTNIPNPYFTLKYHVVRIVFFVFPDP